MRDMVTWARRLIELHCDVLSIICVLHCDLLPQLVLFLATYPGSFNAAHCVYTTVS